MPHLTVDITLPTLVPAVGEAHGMSGGCDAALRAALDHKDAAAVTALAGKAGKLFERLLLAAGPAAATLAALDRLDLPERGRAERVRLGAVLDGLAAAAPELKVTVDPVENRGFEYHTGISFTFFAAASAAQGALGELCRRIAGDRVHPLYRHDFEGVAGGTRVLPRAAAARHRLRPGQRVARSRLGHCRRARTGW